MAYRELAAAALAAALLSATQGQGKEVHSYVVEGPGRMACADFVQLESGSEGQRDAAAWLMGYLTAHHKLLPDVFDLSAWQTPAMLLGLVRQYCLAHSEAVVERGAQELVVYLAPRALKQPAEVVALQNGTDVSLIYLPVLKEARERLAAAGYPPGTTEEELSAALRAYQASKGIAETGLPDQATLTVLLN